MAEVSTPTTVYLDAMAFIFAIEGIPKDSDPVRNLLTTLRNHPGVGVTSELSLAEVLAGSELPHSPPIRRAYLDLIVWSKFIDLVPVTRDILYERADMRFAHLEAHGKKLKLPDAIHLVTSVKRNCRYFVSADKGIRTPKGISRITPDAVGVAEIVKVLA